MCYKDCPDGSYQHEYVLRDHLGNTRVTFSDANNDGLVGSTDIKQINAYYPFGLNMESNFNGAAEKNKYAYNGKEWNDDFGLGLNDYGARFYDPALARWSVVDPLAEKYNKLTTYGFVNNNPMINREIDGRYFDEKNEKAAQKIEKAIDKRVTKLTKEASKLEKKGNDASDIKARIQELGQSKSDIADMRSNSDVEYKYGKLGSKEAKKLDLGGPTTTSTGKNAKGDDVVTMFTENTMGSKLHEGRHGGQSARGEYDIKTGANYGVQEEISAYRAQYSWSGNLQFRDSPSEQTMMARLMAGKDPTAVNLTNINHIDAQTVNSMVDPGFKPIYPPSSIPLDIWNKN